MIRKTFLSVPVIIICTTLFLGCEEGSSPAGSSLADNLFTEAVKDVAPVFDSGATGAGDARATTTWNLGDPIYELYGVLKEGDPVGYFNLHDTMESADYYFKDLFDSGTAITEQSVNAPLDVGFNSQDSKTIYDTLYEYGSDGGTDNNNTMTFGRVDENQVVYMLYTSYNENSGKNKHIVQGWYDETSGDLEIGMFMANYVESPVGWEIVRAFVAGNAVTNTFSLKIIRDGTGYDHNMVGYGISQGTGNYFLMHLANATLNYSLAKYYQFEADAALTALQAMDAAGADTAPAETAAYVTELPANFTDSDLPDQTETEALNVLSVTYTP